MFFFSSSFLTQKWILIVFYFVCFDTEQNFIQTVPLFDSQFLQLFKSKTLFYVRYLEQDLSFNMNFIWLKSVNRKLWWLRALSLKLCLVRFSHWKIQINDFGLIFFVVKHFPIIITFNRSGGFWSNKFHFKAYKNLL